jgi:hypothetical protein
MCKALGFTFKEVNIEHHLLLIHRKITTDKSHTHTNLYLQVQPENRNKKSI